MIDYVVSHEAWYWPVVQGIREVVISRPAPEDGVVWEFAVRERVFVSGAPIGLWVEVADDAWAAFTEVPQVFAELAAISARHRARADRAEPRRLQGGVGRPALEVPLSEVVDVCRRLGYRDVTAREAS